MRPWHDRWALMLPVLLGSGCLPSDLDKAVAKAPVVSVQTPGGFKSGDFGPLTIALPPPTTDTRALGRVLVAGTQGAALAVIDLDAKGKTRQSVAGGSDLGEMQGYPAKSLALIGGGTSLLTGVPTFGAVNNTTVPRGRTFIINLRPTPGGVAFTVVKGPDSPMGKEDFGRGVAVGQISGGAAEDFVVVGGDDVFLFEDAAAVSDGVYGAGLSAKDGGKCADVDFTIPNELPEAYQTRAVVVGDFLPDPGNEIAVGVPRDDRGTGLVVILRKNAGALECAAVLNGPLVAGKAPGAFGVALLGGDLDGDGKLDDLLVGAPQDRAYLIKGPFVTGAVAPLQTLLLPAGDAGGRPEFGLRLAALNLDGVPGYEYVVSAPFLSPGGVEGAGQIYLYRGDGSLLARVAQHNPDKGATLGLGLAGLSQGFGCSAYPGGGMVNPDRAGNEPQLLVAGAARELLTYFKLPVGPADPRCF